MLFNRIFSFVFNPSHNGLGNFILLRRLCASIGDSATPIPSQNISEFPRFTVQQLLESSVDEAGLNARVRGWISSARIQKKNTFVDLTDGSGVRHLQVVVKSADVDGDAIALGAAVEVIGLLVPSRHPQQTVELRGDELQVLGEVSSKEFPIKAKTRHQPGYLRAEAPEHRHRTKLGTAMLKIRNDSTLAFHKFFQRRDFLLVAPPIVTSNDCEGAGEVFRLTAKDDGVLGENGESRSYFHTDAFLTVSGQLHLEALVHGLSKVYSFGPTFRADKSRSRMHLSEFYMAEAEVAFVESVEDLCDLVEDLLKTVSQSLMTSRAEELALFRGTVPLSSTAQSGIVADLNSSFARISYSDALDILKRSNDFSTLKWGDDFNKEMEKILVEHVGKPVFITDFPASLKAFYAKGNDDGRTCASFDLLLPEVGEVCGGSLREHVYGNLVYNMREKGVMMDPEDEEERLKWYVDLRKFGSVPHGGFGVGFERYLQYLTGVANIRECIPFPRVAGKCWM